MTRELDSDFFTLAASQEPRQTRTGKHVVGLLRPGGVVPWGWAFRELTRDIPCVTIPDDHGVYHGNVWGDGGRHAERQDGGGYMMDARFANMIQRTQTHHLPDPVDPAPVEQGIEVNFTSLVHGGISTAVIEDRKWKSSPTVAVPEGKAINGWFRNPDFDIDQVD